MARLQQREGDLPERAPRSRTVDRGSLVHVRRDRLERGEIEEHHRPRRRPRVDAGDRRQRGLRVEEPRFVKAEDLVEEAVDVQHVERDRRDRRRRRQRGEVERAAEEGAAGALGEETLS